MQLYFETHGSQPSESRAPLVLLHGFSGSSQDWAPLVAEWSNDFRLIVPDLRGHGRSGTLTSAFRFDEAAGDLLELLDGLGIGPFQGLGVSGGGNILLHLATKQPKRVTAMVLVSATPYFPPQARHIMRNYAADLGEADWEILRRRHPGGDAQIQALLASTTAFADSYDDLNFTPTLLSTIDARTLIIQGDRDPLYPLEISVDLARAIPKSRLWIVPGGGHGPIGGERWPEFVKTAGAFLRG